MKKINKILVPTDLTAFSLSALDYAFTVSEMFNAELYIIYVFDKLPLLSLPSFNPETIQNEKSFEVKTTVRLKKIIHEKYSGNKNINFKILYGSVYDEILNFINNEKIDIVIMTTHGRPGLAHFLLGSVAEKIVRYSPVPVLTVKPNPDNEPLMETEDIEQQLHINEINN